MIFFNIYFSTDLGFILEFPFLQFQLSAPVTYALILSVILLRIRKLIRKYKKNKIDKIIPSDFENDFEIDWSK